MRPKKKRGRPAFKPTKAQREKVELLKVTGMRDQAIADALGISRETLTKYFADELFAGRARKEADVIDMLWKKARAGNVTAQIKLYNIVNRVGAAEDRGRQQREGRGTGPLGKKDAAKLAAQTAGDGSDWGTDLDPHADRSDTPKRVN